MQFSICIIAEFYPLINAIIHNNKNLLTEILRLFDNFMLNLFQNT